MSEGEKATNQNQRDAMLAAYAALQNNNASMAKSLLIIGLEGGSVNNPLDLHRCLSSWHERVAKHNGRKG